MFTLRRLIGVRRWLVLGMLGSLAGVVSPTALMAQAATPEAKAARAKAEAAPQEEVYKTIGEIKLKAFIFTPPGHQASDAKPAIVFFFGGGWRSGTPQQFAPQCQHLAARGMVAIAVDYRVASRHPVKIKDCVEDAKSAIRWTRSNAKRLGIDPDRIAAGGGSAGGHLAAATATLTGFEAEGEDAAISSRPNALVLFNPAVVLAPVPGKLEGSVARGVDLEERAGVAVEKVSPYHSIHKDLPPTIIFHGQADSTVPYATVELYRDACLAAGTKCELVGYEGQPHGFFNHGRKDGKYAETLAAMDEFLTRLGYLPAGK